MIRVKKKRIIITFFTVVLLLLGLSALSFAATKADLLNGKKIIYIPVDDRPVCYDFVNDTFKGLPVKVVVPPKEWISHRTEPAKLNKVWTWLEKEALKADVLVVSADAMIYGGLVPSRRHELSSQTITERLEKFKKLKQINPRLQIYVFTTIMRTPRASAGGTEPDYYDIYGPQIFRITQLLDMKDRGTLTQPSEIEELKILQDKVPKANLDDWFTRREINLNVNEKWIQWAKDGFVDYLILCRDDSAEFSQSQREWRILKPQSRGLHETRFHAFPGADEVGMLLLTRAINDLTFSTPQIGVIYAPGVGGKTIPTYEDQPFEENINAHIYALGGFPALNLGSADLILMVNTPFKGATFEANQPVNNDDPSKQHLIFTKKIQEQVSHGKRVAVVDIAYGNGADRGLMKALSSKNLLYEIDGYAGWNTAGNSLGFALSQGYLSEVYLHRNKVNQLLTIRYLDDWGYQSIVRSQVNQDVIWPKNINGTNLGESQAYVEAYVGLEMKDFISEYLKDYLPNGIRLKKVEMPWSRMFEVLPILED